MDDNTATNPENSQNGNKCITSGSPKQLIVRSSSSSGETPVKLLWQKSPGGGPLVINDDGSLGISDSPSFKLIEQCVETTDSDGHIIDGLCIVVSSTVIISASPSDLTRYIVEYIEKPVPGAVVAIQSQLNDRFYLMAFPSEINQPVRGGEPDGGFKSDTHAWWRPVAFDKPSGIILLQYYGDNYQYKPDDPRSLYLAIESCESQSGKCNFFLRPHTNATTDGNFQWGKYVVENIQDTSQ